MGVNDDGGSFEDMGTTSERNPHKPWPFIRPDQQAQVEDRFFEDGATIDFDKLPPPQWWAPFFGRKALTPDRQATLVVANIIQLADGVGRKLTQPEIDATSQISAEKALYLSWIPVLGIGGGAAAAAAGRKKFRFPFYTPKGTTFSPYCFPSKARPLATGQVAARLWHVVRFGCYVPWTVVGALVFMTSVMHTNIVVAMSKDPRLGGVGRTLQRRAEEQAIIDKQRKMQRLGIPDPTSSRAHPKSPSQSTNEALDQEYTATASSDEEASISPSRALRKARKSVPADDWRREDAQNDNNFASSDMQESGNLSSERIVSERTPDQQSQDRPQPSQPSRWGLPRPTSAPPRGPSDTQSNQTDAPREWNDNDLFDDDDASPVSASARRPEQQQSQQDEGGSAWSRLRQKAQSQARDVEQAKEASAASLERGERIREDTAWGRLRQDSAPTERDSQHAGPPTEENYTYSEDDEKKGYAQSQAQREFDAMLEAERQGRESDGGSSWTKPK